MYGNEQKLSGSGVTYAGAAAMAQDAGKAVPELQVQVERLSKALSFAEESLAELANRLDGVTRPQAPEPAPTTGNQLAAVGPSTRYGTVVHEFAFRTNRLGERLQDLLRRLEA